MRIFRRLLPLFFAPLLALLPLQQSRAEVDVSLNITVAPPALPVYAQPVIPAEGYIWAPGYWAWGPAGYYWVPGTWVLPPRVGLLWTPGYWGWADGFYAWHAGYWGPHIGYYGGVNYGFGYIGVGFFGGFWDHDHFHYNQAVNNFGGTHITNVYNKTVVNNVNITNNNTNISRVSYNGGQGGLTARPNADEQAAAREEHVQPTRLQAQHQQMASNNTALRASVNHGRPSIAATPRPAAFTEHGTVGARGANGAPNGQHQAATPNGGPQHPQGQNGGPQHPQAQNGGPQHPQGQNGGPQHSQAQSGALPHQGNAHMAAANGQRPPHQPGQPGQPGGHPQGGPQHPVKAAAAHPGGPQNPGGQQHPHPQQGAPQNHGPAPQGGGEQHPDNHDQPQH